MILFIATLVSTRSTMLLCNDIKSPETIIEHPSEGQYTPDHTLNETSHVHKSTTSPILFTKIQLCGPSYRSVEAVFLSRGKTRSIYGYVFLTCDPPYC